MNIVPFDTMWFIQWIISTLWRKMSANFDLERTAGYFDLEWPVRHPDCQGHLWRRFSHQRRLNCMCCRHETTLLHIVSIYFQISDTFIVFFQCVSVQIPMWNQCLQKLRPSCRRNYVQLLFCGFTQRMSTNYQGFLPVWCPVCRSSDPLRLTKHGDNPCCGINSLSICGRVDVVKTVVEHAPNIRKLLIL